MKTQRTTLFFHSPVFSDLAKLDPYHQTVKYAPQLELSPMESVSPEQFPRDCHSSQVPQRCISLPVATFLTSESQIYLTDASYTERTDSATRYSDTVSDALCKLPNSVDTNNHAELQHTVLTIQENKEKQSPELNADDAGNHATEPITDDLLIPTWNESGEPISDELLIHSKHKEEEECTPLNDLCNTDWEMSNNSKPNSIYPTEVPKPSVQKLMKKTEVSRPDSARECISGPITEEIHKLQTDDNTDHIPGHTKKPHKDVEPANSPESTLGTVEPVELPPGQVAMPAIPESQDILNFPVRAPLHSNLTGETGIVHGLPPGDPITATETSYTEPLAQPSIPITDDLPDRADISLLPKSSLLSELCKREPCRHSLTSSTQPDRLCVQFPEDCHPVQVTEQCVSLSCSHFSSFEPEVSESIVYEPPVHKAPTDLKELKLREASYPINCDNYETGLILAYLPSKRGASSYLSLKPPVIETKRAATNTESSKQATQDNKEDEPLKEEIPVNKVLAGSVQKVLHQVPKRRNSNSQMATDICIEFKHTLKQSETSDIGTTHHHHQREECIPKFSTDMPSTSQVIFDKLASDVVTHDLTRTHLLASSVRPSVLISSAGDMKKTNIGDMTLMLSNAEDTSVSRTSILTVSDSHDTRTYEFRSPLIVSSLPMSKDDMSTKTNLKIPVPMPEDDTDHCDAELDTLRQLMHLHCEPDLPSFTSSQSCGHTKHVSTPSSESQVQTPATKYVVLPAISLPQGTSETKHPRALGKVRLQAEGISNHSSFTEIGLCAHQPPNLLNDLHAGLFSVALQRYHGESSTWETLGIG